MLIAWGTGAAYAGALIGSFGAAGVPAPPPTPPAPPFLSSVTGTVTGATANNLPVRSPMYIARDGSSADGGTLSRPWQDYFNSLRTAATAAVPFIRTLLLYSTTVDSDIAPWLVAQGSGQVVFIAAVLRKDIAADLSININLNGQPFVSMTIPAATDPGAVLTETPPDPLVITLGDWFSFDVTASDGSSDPNGVASFTILWAALQ